MRIDTKECVHPFTTMAVSNVRICSEILLPGFLNKKCISDASAAWIHIAILFNAHLPYGDDPRALENIS